MPEDLAWNDALSGLWTRGYGRLGTLLCPRQCEEMRSLYDNGDLFRSRIDMARYRFGRGEYQYFAYPLPDVVERLRHELYSGLVDVATEWMQALSLPQEYPPTLDDFLKTCHNAGQQRPTPLILQYGTGDYNCLHQDLYGEIFFPFQVVIGLSRPGQEFTGGELLLLEQQARAQSIGHAIRLEQGEAVVITTRYRPAKGARGYYRTNFRHGVSPLLSGERYTLGVIFHDAA
ncbi:MAG TPA: 2OG-Fe(II) oxygenase [Bryobacteraceae bacterium]|nr:2OG-Fe(II) oxygenase [Bryobacteraceae bacterium]